MLRPIRLAFILLAGAVFPLTAADVGAGPTVEEAKGEAVSASDTAQTAARMTAAHESFGGVGLRLDKAENGAKVIRVLSGAPADKAGLQVGCVIMAIDGKKIKDMPLEQTSLLLRGPIGSTVSVIFAGTDGQERSVSLTRGEIPGLKGKRIDYILASPELAETCTDARVLHTEDLDRLSDHYPVMANLALKDPQTGQTVSLRVITYNVLEGFRKDPAREAGVAAWLASQKPDVVALQELLNFTPERLEKLAQKWGHSYSVLLNLKGYSTGLTSSRRIADVRKTTDGFWHGLLECETQGITFLVVHLGAPKIRHKEAVWITKRIRGLQETKSPTIVLGDFNTLSPDDADLYFTAPSLEAEYPTFRLFMDAGVKDLVALRRKPGDWAFTVSTPLAQTYHYIGEKKKQDATEGRDANK